MTGLPVSFSVSCFIALDSDPWCCCLCPRDSPQSVLSWQMPSDPLSQWHPMSPAAAEVRGGCSSMPLISFTTQSAPQTLPQREKSKLDFSANCEGQGWMSNLHCTSTDHFQDLILGSFKCWSLILKIYYHWVMLLSFLLYTRDHAAPKHHYYYITLKSASLILAGAFQPSPAVQGGRICCCTSGCQLWLCLKVIQTSEHCSAFRVRVLITV